MVGAIAFVLGAVVVVVLIGKVSTRFGLPDAVLLTVVGVIYAFLPGPNLLLKPEVVLDIVIPPLLYHAALGSSLLAIRSRLRLVVSLSVLLVLATAGAVGGMLTWLIPAVPVAAAMALGAAVGPTDPVAALAVARRVGLPSKLSTLVEGEGLLNDATALTAFAVAISVASGAGFSAGGAVGQFALAAVGGVVVGVAVAVVVRLSRRVLGDPMSTNAISLATPFAAYLVGEAVHGSGVLAVVVAGLVIGHRNGQMQTGAARLQTTAVWNLVNFLLEGFVFLLIGQQIPTVIEGLGPYSVGTVVAASAITVGTVIVLRPIWLLLTQYVPRSLHARLGGESDDDHIASEDHTARDERLSAKEILALSWAGTRGVITLAAAFAIPLTTATGEAFPARNLLLFCAYLVVLVTLLGQGLTFGPLLHRLGLRANFFDLARTRNQARAAAADAALTRLDQLVDEEGLPEEVTADLRRRLTARQQRYHNRLAFMEENPGTVRSPEHEASARALRGIIDAQHEELLRWRDAGRLPDQSLRILQRELDHEERTLPMPPK